MRLFYSPTSPYARKALATAIEKGLDGAIALVTLNPLDDDPALLAANPLGKVPALALDDGRVLFDSPVICAYLDETGSGPRLTPADDAGRLAAATREALADGLADAALAIVMERRRPAAQRSPYWLERWARAIRRATQVAEADPPAGPLDHGHLALAVALGYLDFRLPDLDWAADAPRLGAWRSDISARESLARTAPPAA
ncbi:MAG: glutathione S-transferase N-terminal domain-containing protein [Caulobacterales bacterium]|nr:glutathione S-transferase N-terminal domain-containing protein [Caulobacterales bacterium]